MQHKIKTLIIADSNPGFRKNVNDLLSSYKNIMVVGEAEDGYEVVTQVFDLNPDLILMDFSLKGISGLALTKMIKLELPRVNIILCSIDDCIQYKITADKAGASGCIVKKNIAKDLIRTINEIFTDDSFHSISN